MLAIAGCSDETKDAQPTSVYAAEAGLIDVGAEKARLEKEIEKTEQDLKRINGKLGNENFVAKAPEEVVAKEREKADGLQGRLTTLAAQIEKLSLLS